jgi:SulP family sulfate permease
VDVLETLRRELTEAGTVVALARVKQDLRDQLGPTGLLERIGEDRIFPTLPTAVEAFQAWQTGRTDPGPGAGSQASADG